MKTAAIGGPSPLRRNKPCPQGTQSLIHMTSPAPQKTARRNSPAAPLPAPFRKGQERGPQEMPPAGEAMSANGNRTREAPASRLSGRGGSIRVRSRRADADNASGCRFRTRSGTSRTRRAPCSSRRAGCCSSRPGTWFRCRIPNRPGPCRRRNPWSGCPVPPWCPCR